MLAFSESSTAGLLLKAKLLDIVKSLAIVLIRASEISLKFNARKVTKSSSTAHCIVELEGVAGRL